MNAGPVRRKLTTILAADVVGYSRLMSSDEDGTYNSLKDLSEFINALVARYNGRLFNEVGDAFLVEFDSTVEAVRCAITMQEDIAARNIQLPEDQQMWLRIGVNVGDVIVDGDNFLGDGVNVAARLEGVSETGGICISGTAFEQVKNKLSIEFEDIGPQQVKNIPQPVSAFRIVPANISIRSGDHGAATNSASPVREAAAHNTPAKTTPSSRRPGLLLASFIVTSVALLAIAGLLLKELVYETKIEKLAVLPKTFSTDKMRLQDIKQVVSDMIIQGAGRKSGNPFVIRLEQGGVAKVKVTKKGSSTIVRNEIGKWWAKDNLFCIKFPGWAQNRRVCPILRKESNKITAVRRKDGTNYDWLIIK